MFGQHGLSVLKAPVPVLASVPVPVGDPCSILLRVTPSGPAPKLLIDNTVHLVEHLLRDYGGVEVCPPPDLGIQDPDELVLPRGPVTPDHRRQVADVSLLRCFAGSDDRLEAKRLTVSVSSRAVLSDWKLTHRKPKEVEPHVSMVFMERVGDPRLRRFEFQTHAHQPLAGETLTLLNDGQIVMYNHKVVGIHHNGRLRAPIRKGCTQMIFEAMESDVGEERRN